MPPQQVAPTVEPALLLAAYRALSCFSGEDLAPCSLSTRRRVCRVALAVRELTRELSCGAAVHMQNLPDSLENMFIHVGNKVWHRLLASFLVLICGR